MDENRLFENKSAFVDNMGALVKRDRNHPSVVIWSFCNEVRSKRLSSLCGLLILRTFVPLPRLSVSVSVSPLRPSAGRLRR